MRVLFLDFDGVLNSLDWIKRRPSKEAFAAEFNVSPEQYDHDHLVWGLRSIDPDSVAALNQIVHRSKARVVVSSSWRTMYALNKLEWMLRARGFEHHLVGATPEAQWLRERGERRISRGEEIQRWMALMEIKPADIVIIDDDGDMDHLRPRLFQTNAQERGLCADHVDTVLKLWGI